MGEARLRNRARSVFFLIHWWPRRGGPDRPGHRHHCHSQSPHPHHRQPTRPRPQQRRLRRNRRMRTTGKTPERTTEDLYAAGRADGTRPVRHDRDFDVDSDTDIVGGGPAPTSPNDKIKGVSNFASTEDVSREVRGWAHRLPAGSELPEGVRVHADGEDVDGYAARGHRTIYPNSGDDVG